MHRGGFVERQTGNHAAGSTSTLRLTRCVVFHELLCHAELQFPICKTEGSQRSLQL